MARFKCPSSTCDFVVTGSIDDITPQAIWHSEGSHQANLSYEDIGKVISEQAMGIFTDYFIQANEKKIDIGKWWIKINK